LLNECANQFVTEALGRISHGPETVAQPDEPERAEEFVMADEDFTQWED
jgi:hypothetical protein